LPVKSLRIYFPLLKQEVIDVELGVSFKGRVFKAKKIEKDGRGTFEVYQPKGGTPKVKETFRLVGVLNKETKKYHLYLTNITSQRLTR